MPSRWAKCCEPPAIAHWLPVNITAPKAYLIAAFDRYYGLRDGAANYFNPGLQREGEPAPACKRSNRAWCIDDKLYEPYTPKEKNFYATDAFTDVALDYLEQYKDENKPFFLYLAYTAPHDPLMAWPADIAKYEGVYDVGYEAIRKARYEKQKRIGLIDERFPLSSPTHQDWNALSDKEKADQSRRMQVYAAMVDRMDQNHRPGAGQAEGAEQV